MKRIKAINGYTIYQATTPRDADNYNCEIGSYNIYLSSDIKDFGLSYSTPEWDDIDSLATAIELASGSNYAVACALADELSDSTIQDMDLCLEIERRLDNGDSIEYIRDSYDMETGRLYETPSEAEAARDDAALADGPEGDLEDMFEEVLSANDRLETGSLRQELIAGRASYDTIDEIENYGIWGVAVLELGHADIEVNVTHEGDHLIAEYFVCLKDSVGDWHSWGYIDRQVTIDWSAPNWRELLQQEMRLELRRYAREREWDLDKPMDAVIDGLYACPGQDLDDGPEEEPAPAEDRPRSHASYYVIEDEDGNFWTHTGEHLVDETPEEFKRLFFGQIAYRIAFSDCGYEHVDEIVFDGEHVHYAGWQPGMLIEFISDSTGEIVYSGSFPEWDH